MTIARWGIVPILLNLALVAWLWWLLPDGWPRWVIGSAALAWLLFVINFFRNPARTPAGGADCVVSSADGIVADIEEVDEPRVVGGRAVRIGVFMNVFDVHVNRACIDGEIISAQYKPGRYLDVRHPDATHQNESHDLGIAVDTATAPGVRLLLRQISGLVARRIVCTHGVGDRLRRGEVFGMIKFGSRVEIWLPVGSGTVAVTVGERVRAGETILFRFGASGE